MQRDLQEEDRMVLNPKFSAARSPPCHTCTRTLHAQACCGSRCRSHRATERLGEDRAHGNSARHRHVRRGGCWGASAGHTATQLPHRVHWRRVQRVLRRSLDRRAVVPYRFSGTVGRGREVGGESVLRNFRTSCR